MGLLRIASTKDRRFDMKVVRGTWTFGLETASLAPRKIVRRRGGVV